MQFVLFLDYTCLPYRYLDDFPSYFQGLPFGAVSNTADNRKKDLDCKLHCYIDHFPLALY